MRRNSAALLILSCLIGLPAWGQTPSVPFCPALSTSGGFALGDVVPAPVFKSTLTCGCGDASCLGLQPGDFCNGEPGMCVGLSVGGSILRCSGEPSTFIQCGCIYID
jgi:hypothetical protein